MNANEAKLLLQEYFRYKRKFIGVVSEYSFTLDEIEDIVAFDDKEIIVVEIKISKSDFLKDFKKHKHTYFDKSYHKFYYFVPNDLLDFVLEYLKKADGSYGVLSVNTRNEVYIAKSAKTLKGSKYLLSVFHYSEYAKLKSLIQRMSSELIIEKRKNLRSKK
ncbi:hypothetical protein LS70_003740 [Helicobacter sp. MIT 11-5569]|uniref:hypothetical protein n=1 Tax=Helicobacter sp. MIT 11-5569 TaxID=1548151 RepID=UPI00051FD61B|nr:hypothetical protein [Helicobacter sp. MIT 11-5569]TLD83930.1 hypothetical protein LS70_003740 [Helicobacter sp. MIT 11-5569]